MSVTKLRPGDRVVVPFTISCGECWFCQKTRCISLLRQVQPQRRDRPQGRWGSRRPGLFGFSHMMGGYPGRAGGIPPGPLRRRGAGQDPRGPPRREGRLPLRHLPDRLHGGRELPRSRPGRRSWRSGAAAPSAQFAIRSAWMLGAGRVDRDRRWCPSDWRWPRKGKAETIDFEQAGRLPHPDGDDPGARPGSLHRRRGLRGAMAAGGSLDAIMDKAKSAVGLTTDRAAHPEGRDHVLPQGRHGLDPRRLRRVPRQDPDGRGDEQGT